LNLTGLKELDAQENCIMRSFIICIPWKYYYEQNDQTREIRWAGYVAHKGEKCTEFWWKNLK
jgi:hypothetical protein